LANKSWADLPKLRLFPGIEVVELSSSLLQAMFNTKRLAKKKYFKFFIGVISS